MIKRYLYLYLVLIIVINFSRSSFAQEIKEENPPVHYEINNVSDLYKKTDEISEDSKTLEKKLKELTDIASIEDRIKPLRESLNDYKQKFRDSKEAENTDIESTLSLRGSVTIISDICNGLKNNVEERLKSIAALNKDWLDKKEYWQNIQQHNNFSNNKAAKDIFNENDKNIEESLKLFEGIDTPVTILNQSISDLNQDANKLAEDIDKFLEELRSRLFKKTGHAMLTSKYINEFDENLSNKFFEGIARLEIQKENYFKNNAWVFIFQLILWVVFSYYFQKSSKDFLNKLGLDFVYKNNIASGLIFGILLGIPFLESFPPIIKFIYKISLVIGFAIIICNKLDNKGEKAGIALVFILFMVYMLFDVIDMPRALSRLIIAIITLASGIYFFTLNKKIKDDFKEIDQEMPLKDKIICKVIGLFMFLSFVGQLAGYTALANHIFDITLKSIIICLFAWLVLNVLRNSISTLFINSFVDKHLKSVIPNADLISKNVNLVVTIFVSFFVFSGILATWGIFDNTWLAAKSILNIGFTIQGVKITLGNVCWAVFLFCLILSISWLVRTSLEVNFYPKKNIEPGVGISINRLIYYSFIVIAFAIAMAVMGISMQSLTVIVGALGVGIGFGLQNIVNNFASGLILLFERSIKVGDIVVVNGTWGTVKHLGLRSTIIQTFANAEMIVPNSDLVSGTVNNWTMTNRKTRFSIKVGVAYGTDTSKVKSVLLKLAGNHNNVLKDPAPSVVFTEFGDSSLNFELRCWVKDIANMWKTQDEIMYEIDNAFKENNISIPFPQRDLYIKEMPSNITEINSENKNNKPEK